MREEMRFRDKLARFMYGRNGMDRLCTGMLVTVVILSVVNVFVHSSVILILEYILILLCLFRALSKNIYKRQRENRCFLRIWSKIKGFFKLQKSRFRDRKTHIYRMCPHCKANLRLPKRKGKHTVRCPKCNLRFEIRS